MVKVFVQVGVHFPEFKSYLNHNKEESCIKQMWKVENNGTFVLRFVRKTVPKYGKEQSIAHLLAKVLQFAFSFLEEKKAEHKLHKKVKKDLPKYKDRFQERMKKFEAKLGAKEKTRKENNNAQGQDGPKKSDKKKANEPKNDKPKKDKKSEKPKTENQEAKSDNSEQKSKPSSSPFEDFASFFSQFFGHAPKVEEDLSLPQEIKDHNEYKDNADFLRLQGMYEQLKGKNDDQMPAQDALNHLKVVFNAKDLAGVKTSYRKLTLLVHEDKINDKGLSEASKEHLKKLYKFLTHYYGQISK